MMQKKSERENPNQNVIATILQKLPAGSKITKIEYEGPRIAIYTTSPKFLLARNNILANLVSTIKKRIVIRTDQSIRKPETEAKRLLMELVPKDAKLQGAFFDDTIGEVTVEVKRPWLLQKNPKFSHNDVVEQLGWRIRIRKATTTSSSTIQTINYMLKIATQERSKQLRQIGDDIFRPKIAQKSEVSLLTLGGFGQVGRSCMLLTTPESRVLLDCGVNPGARTASEAYPRIDWANIALSDVDAVVIGHAHLDHTGFLPVLCKYGYKGPIYCTEPTLPMMNLIQLDAIKVASAQGRVPLYSERDVKQVMKQSITLSYKMVTDISPDIKLVLANAGHILGSALCHFHIGNGDHNFVYSGDIKFGKSILFEAAEVRFPRVETLLVESTYGLKEDIQPSRQEVESAFINVVNQTLADGGKVLIPIPAVGRAQEIMMVIDHYMKAGEMVEAPVFTEGMISEASAIHESYPEYLARELRQKILETDDNPFDSEYFTNIEHTSARGEAMREDTPSIILATSGMLEGGPVLEYFKNIAPHRQNKILFVSYQVNGTMGRRVLDGARQVSMLGRGGKVEAVTINAGIEKLDGFSGHSDYNQLMSFVQRLRPKLKRVLVNHGERRKSDSLAANIRRMYRLPAHNPQVQEAVKLF
ncbi:MAG: beta-CASP ribonuclease aCPSF1 [Cenarchaeum sp. SB0665_bin_23]|nr:beta-CASP ribonuclease aCPSF1 [Cenarchaeum sp. SB0667_bin_13]MXY37753.1 beta-CASP ribonuclease aCPSF1 [Cenarchaeum sp. SB0664_bin_35]MXY60890.1 beta-CASP ribonuclease aCPSF1 [Cenarchaeum sp. SB0665_bin_23]MYB47126.1 beta-CASP ribonuclease aCPSF1 [Cenarchaeum sp. SB0662_bin_33]MYC80326.1 beta-CASP ribonuclease aCPSF1 [Cenarchaeum sp. SB0661_bin_35]MYG32782.1 beta-CASP ribonuclease aCPSF1 [Cenarchaeum sp. SB0677_bin_16]MYI51247.1 beta-CASP ribonuclease aCPSF1 [Cenarchaeum sp. SB0673_bin_9]